MTKLTISELVESFLTKFPLVWDINLLEKTIENNSWHQKQSVSNHTYEVIKSLDKIIALDNKYLGYLEQNRNNYIKYFQEKLFNRYPRIMYLKLAALFHDIGKPDTLIINDLGETSCPNHWLKSLELIKEIVNLVDINEDELSYIKKIILYHHEPDSFLEYAGKTEYSKRKSEFIKKLDNLSIDLLTFYLADFEGCSVEPEIEETKRQIYNEVAKVISELLNEF